MRAFSHVFKCEGPFGCAGQGLGYPGGMTRAQKAQAPSGISERLGFVVFQVTNARVWGTARWEKE